MCVNDNNAQDVNGCEWESESEREKGCERRERKRRIKNCDVWAQGGNDGGNTWFSDSF